MYSRETEIRHISPADIFKLAQILDSNNAWKKLMQIIPKDFRSDQLGDMTYKYNYESVRLVESASVKQNRSATEILLDEWGTSGRNRPTLGVLLELLVRAELIRAIELVARSFLNEEPPARPVTGPAAPVDIDLPLDLEFIEEVEDMLNNGDYDPGTETLNDNVQQASLQDNNVDFHERHNPFQKRLDIPPSSNELNNSNCPVTDNGASTPELTSTHSQMEVVNYSSESVEIPNLSVLGHTEAKDGNFSQLSINIPIVSALNHLQSSGPILPDISLLNVQDVPPNELPPTTAGTTSMLSVQLSSDDMLPNLSVFNIENSELDDDKLKPPEEAASMLSSSSVSSLSSSPDDNDDLSAPNLSILDHRSSNNDSSLTNVTGTSEDNSFEISLNEGSASNDNIPCLSTFK